MDTAFLPPPDGFLRGKLAMFMCSCRKRPELHPNQRDNRWHTDRGTPASLFVQTRVWVYRAGLRSSHTSYPYNMKTWEEHTPNTEENISLVYQNTRESKGFVTERVMIANKRTHCMQ